MISGLVIIGAGGFGRETLDVVRAINDVSPTWRFLGFIDDKLSSRNRERLTALEMPHLGGIDALPNGIAVAVAIGDPSTRKMIVEALAGRHTFPSLVHPTTTRGSELHFGDGLIVLGGVSLGTNVSIGNHVHLNAHCVIGHDATISDYVSINPNATISGECNLEQGSLIGAGSVVLQGLTIGPSTIVGASACVTRHVTQNTTVTGIPARPESYPKER